MSYSFDGKVTNQCPRLLNYTSSKSTCAKCGKIIEAPKVSYIELNNKVYCIRNYLDSPHFIYETKIGISVVYCSDYCRKKHNHRFQK